MFAQHTLVINTWEMHSFHTEYACFKCSRYWWSFLVNNFADFPYSADNKIMSSSSRWWPFVTITSAIKPLHIAPPAHQSRDVQRWVRAWNVLYFEPSFIFWTTCCEGIFLNLLPGCPDPPMGSQKYCRGTSGYSWLSCSKENVSRRSSFRFSLMHVLCNL